MLLGNIDIGSDEHLVVDAVVQRPVLNNQSEHKGRLQKKKTSYLVTLSQSVWVGQDKNTLSEASEIMTNLL